MALITEDRVMESSTTTGTGAFTLAGNYQGFRTFASVCATNDTAYYAIEAIDVNGQATGEWETGLGTYSAANTLTRTTVHKSSNANAAVNFAAGTKRVMLAVTETYLDAKLTFVRVAGAGSNYRADYESTVTQALIANSNGTAYWGATSDDTGHFSGQSVNASNGWYIGWRNAGQTRALLNVFGNIVAFEFNATPYVGVNAILTAVTGMQLSGGTMTAPLGFASYTVATLPAVGTAGRMIYVSDEVGGAVPAFTDGTNWRRVTDRAIVA